MRGDGPEPRLPRHALGRLLFQGLPSYSTAVPARQYSAVLLHLVAPPDGGVPRCACRQSPTGLVPARRRPGGAPVGRGGAAWRAGGSAARCVGRSGERWTYTASGPVTNVAARLCTLAQEGAIVLSEVTASLLTDTYVVQPLGAYHLKNIPSPIEVYRLLGERRTVTT